MQPSREGLQSLLSTKDVAVCEYHDAPRYGVLTHVIVELLPSSDDISLRAKICPLHVGKESTAALVFEQESQQMRLNKALHFHSVFFFGTETTVAWQETNERACLDWSNCRHGIHSSPITSVFDWNATSSYSARPSVSSACLGSPVAASAASAWRSSLSQYVVSALTISGPNLSTIGKFRSASSDMSMSSSSVSERSGIASAGWRHVGPAPV
ncbi:hypothetical protein KCU81_g368, partial [Aureobasidium melanogenum]